MSARKAPAGPPPEKLPDLRSLLQRAAEDDPLISANFTLEQADGLLHCRHCYFVTAQELNAEAHLHVRHPETLDPVQPDGAEPAVPDKEA